MSWRKPTYLVGNAILIKLPTRPIWAPARQGYLAGPALLTTHRPGHISSCKAGPWPSKLSAAFSTSVRRAISDLRFGGARTYRPGQESCRSARTFRICLLNARALKWPVHHTWHSVFPGEIALIDIFCSRGDNHREVRQMREQFFGHLDSLRARARCGGRCLGFPGFRKLARLHGPKPFVCLFVCFTVLFQ